MSPIAFPSSFAGAEIAFRATHSGAAIAFHVTLPDSADFDATDFASEDFDTT